MRVFPLALHLPPLLLRLLQLVLPLPPFAPGPSPQRPQALPTPCRRYPATRHRPARRPLPLGADAPLAPAHPAKACPAPHRGPRTRSLGPATPQTQPRCTPPRQPSYPRPRVSTLTTRAPQTWPNSAPPQPKSFLEKTLTAREAHRRRPADAPAHGDLPAPNRPRSHDPRPQAARP